MPLNDKGAPMSDLLQEIRHGVRALFRARGLTVATVIILGLGIGASTTIFSAVNGVLRRPLPYADPDRLVALWESNPRQHTDRAGVSAPDFVDWRGLTRTLEGLAAYRPWGFVLTGGEPERVLGAKVTANLFPLLGVGALRGRTLLPEEDRLGNDNVVMLSEELWQRRFGADPALIGKSLHLDGKSYMVVGIVRAQFDLPAAELWVPLAFEPYAMAQRGTRALSVIARLKPGVELAAARQDAQAIAGALGQRYPDSNAGWGVIVTPLHQEITGASRTPLLLLFAATGALLLLACANLATLMLARNAVRRHEIAVRAALGARRFRIVRQLGTESMITALAGGAAGVALAILGTQLLASLGPAYLPRSSEIRLDWLVLGFALLITLVTGVVFAMSPALEVTRVDLTESMKAGGPDPVRQTLGVPFRDLLVVAQFAFAFLLLVGAGLLVRSMLRVQSVELGFRPDRVLSMTVSLPNWRYPGGDQRAAFFRDLTRHVEALPGIRAAGFVSHLPLAAGAPGALSSDFIIEGRAPMSSGEVPTVELRNVDAGYFRTMGIRLVGGRAFADDEGSREPVVIVDEAFVSRFLPNQDPLRQRLRVGATSGADLRWRQIVGIVSSVRSASLEIEPRPTVYVPYYQNPWPTMSLVVSTSSDPARFAGVVRGAVQALDRDQPVYNVRSLDQVLARAAAARRFQTTLLCGFAVTAVALAITGLYALLAFTVAQRTRELGIRVALGARRSDVLAFVIRHALELIAVGLFVGLGSAMAGSRLLTSILFEISPWDRVTFVGSAVLLTTTGLVASYLPARRAANADPARALRRV
jgi:putative ABC transport system permease protein